MALEAADLMARHCARRYEGGQACGAETSLDACGRAVRTHGGDGHIEKCHVEGHFGQIAPRRIALAIRQRIGCCIVKRVLEPSKYC